MFIIYPEYLGTVTAGFNSFRKLPFLQPEQAIRRQGCGSATAMWLSIPCRVRLLINVQRKRHVIFRSASLNIIEFSIGTVLSSNVVHKNTARVRRHLQFIRQQLQQSGSRFWPSKLSREP